MKKGNGPATIRMGSTVYCLQKKIFNCKLFFSNCSKYHITSKVDKRFSESISQVSLFMLFGKPFPSFIGKLLKCLSCQNAFRPFSEGNKLSADSG